MKRLISFTFFVLIVTFLILMLSPDFSFAKSKKAWLRDLPGVPPRLYMGNLVYFHTSRAYPGINASSPIIKMGARMDTWTNLPAKSSMSVKTIFLSTATLDGATSTYLAGWVTQTDYARDLGVSWDIANSSVIWCNVTIVGTDARGNIITEVVIATATVVAYTNNAFASITTVTLGAIQEPAVEVGDIASIYFNIGTGDKIGLMGAVTTTDYFYKGTVANVDETASFTISAIYDTWTHSDVPDGGDDYILWYKIDSGTNPR